MITFVRSAALSWKYHVSCPCWRQNHKWWGCGSTPLYGPGAELLGLNNCSRRESDRETKKRPRLLRYGSSSKDKPEKVGPNLPRRNVFLNLNGESRLHRRLEKYLPPFFRRWRQSRDALDRRRLNPPTDWRWRRDLTYCLLTRLGSSTNLLVLYYTKSFFLSNFYFFLQTLCRHCFPFTFLLQLNVVTSLPTTVLLAMTGVGFHKDSDYRLTTLDTVHWSKLLLHWT